MEPPGQTAPLAAIATNLRRLRELAGFSIGELGRRAGVAKSTVSNLEAGTGNPSIETLWALARALEATFAQLVEEPRTSVRVMRAGSAPIVPADGSPYGVRLLDSIRRARCDLYVVESDPGPSRHAEAHPPGTIEHIVITSGALRCGPVGDEVTLAEGDYAVFAGDVQHGYETLEPGTRAFLVMEHF